MMDILVHWINERESIRIKKERGDKKPWTNDPLLRDYKWCNVRRMDDRVSRWLIANWYDPKSSIDTQLIAAVLARFINWPDGLRYITDVGAQRPFRLTDLSMAADRLKIFQNSGSKIFTGAYIVPGKPGLSKIDSVIAVAKEVYCLAQSFDRKAAWRMWAHLCEFDYVGPFISGQIVADLAELPYGEHWDDVWYWAPMGPGSKRGMNRLHGRNKDAALSQKEFASDLEGLIQALYDRASIDGSPDFKFITSLKAIDFQNCLCEFDKYRRLTLGEGSVRAKYPGAA
jgi:hypothetical protein